MRFQAGVPLSVGIPTGFIASKLRTSRTSVLEIGLLQTFVAEVADGVTQVTWPPWPFPHYKPFAAMLNSFYVDPPVSNYDQLRFTITVDGNGVWSVNPCSWYCPAWELVYEGGSLIHVGKGYKTKVVGRTHGVLCHYGPVDCGNPILPLKPDIDAAWNGRFCVRAPLSYEVIAQETSGLFEFQTSTILEITVWDYPMTNVSIYWPGRHLADFAWYRSTADPGIKTTDEEPTTKE